MDFDVVPYEDITWGETLDKGGFGSVYRGQYLGLDIAIKEIRPSTEYNVRKYFEREWRIMRECRHPNIVQFVGLSQEPGTDGRVFIVSEYVPGGNLRNHIRSAAQFPWSQRLSFASDIARAVAYLHARQCMHRDLKGENLLLTNDNRIKVADFGFARITTRGPDEVQHMTYCGTDGYMSPEIITGEDFDLPTDVYSLGILLIEILTRTLVGSKAYSRQAPHFTPDPIKVRQRASPGCPSALIELALHCCSLEPKDRPTMPQVLQRLRSISPPDDCIEGAHNNQRLRYDGKRALPFFANPFELTEALTPLSNQFSSDMTEAQVEEVLFDIASDNTVVLRSSSQPSVSPESGVLERGTCPASFAGYQTASEMNDPATAPGDHSGCSITRTGSSKVSADRTSVMSGPATRLSASPPLSDSNSCGEVESGTKSVHSKHHFSSRPARGRMFAPAFMATLIGNIFPRTTRDKCICCSKLLGDIRQCQQCGVMVHWACLPNISCDCIRLIPTVGV